MIRYQFGGEELPVAAASGPPDEDNWWADVNRCAVRVALTATLLAAATARLAQATANPATDDLQFVSAVDEAESHGYVAPSLGLPNRQPPTWGRDDQLVSATIIADFEQVWISPRPQVRVVPPVPQWGTDDEFFIPTVVVTDEEGWQPPRPQLRAVQPAQPVSVTEEITSTFDDDTAGPIVVRWPVRAQARVFWTGDDLTPIVSDSTIANGAEGSVAISGQIASVGTLACGAEGGCAIAGQIEAIGTLASGAEGGVEIASQEEDVAMITSGAQGGTAIAAQIESKATVELGAEAGVAINGGMQLNATVECGAECGVYVLGNDFNDQPTFGGGYSYVERRLEAREWMAAHAAPRRNPLDLTPITTPRAARTQVLDNQVPQPHMPPTINCTVDSSSGVFESDVAAQIESVVEIEVDVRAIALRGRAAVTGDTAEEMQVIAWLVLQDRLEP